MIFSPQKPPTRQSDGRQRAYRRNRTRRLLFEPLEDRHLLSGETLSVAIATDSIEENAGAAATTATVTRSDTDTGSALTVDLSSSDASEATVPSTVTIPADSFSASFNIDAVDDDLLDGTQSVTITASATDYTSSSDTLDVTDDHEVIDESGSFATEIERLKGLAFARDSDRYVEPEATELGEFSTLATMLLSGDLAGAANKAATVDYEIVDFADTSTGEVYRGLREELDAQGEQTRGWGSYFLDLSPSANALVEIPHPVYDTRSWEIGANAFIQADARAFLMAGAHRHANGNGTADVAHLQDSVFQEVHEVWNGGDGQYTAWQIHGFNLDGQSAFPAGTDVVFSNGDGTVSADIGRLDQQFEAAQGLSVAVADDSIPENGGSSSGNVERGFRGYAYNGLAASDPINVQVNDGVAGATFSSLAATTNVQGIHSRDAGGVFVHIELEQSIRFDADNRRLAASAVAEAIGGSSANRPAVTVNLVSDDTSEATVPSTVTIPADSSLASFNTDAVDDDLLDGTQSVTITASATGYTS